jgi:hypothetical protein
MIISEEIKNNDKIIKVSDLTKGSHQIIDAKCDFCEKIVNIQYRFYLRQTKDMEVRFACSKKCASIRTKEYLLENFGVSNISQLPDVKKKIMDSNLQKYGSETYFGSSDAKEKSKKTCLEKYGTENYTKTDIYIERVKKTNLEKYGSEWYLSSEDKKTKSDKTNLEKYGTTTPSKSESVKSKIIKTNLDKYGFNSPLLNDEIKQKSKDTLIQNWGVDNPFKSPEIREKSNKTNLEKYGYFYPIQSSDIVEIRKKNNLIKYGSENFNQNEEFRKNNFKIANHPNYISYIGQTISLFHCDVCKKDFEIRSDNFYKRIEQDLNLCTICNPIGDFVSIKEQELFKFIKSNYQGQIIQSYRDGLEIDIYLPEINLGFEFNGIYWHSSEYLDKNYHLNKLNHFKERGIRIINIWEDDWNFKQDLIKSMILHILNQTPTKIYARQCEIREIKDIKKIKEFLNSNHIQGWVNSKVKIGLYYNNELMSLMVFDQSEGRKKMNSDEWNLSRFCNKLNINIVGGASKLINFFVINFKPKRIISFADKDWSVGNIYEKMGFNKLYETKPDYKYIKAGVRKHKANFKVNEAKIELPKIWDCGKIKFEKKI